MYIVQFQNPAREPDKIFGSRVEQTFDFLMRDPVRPPARTSRRRLRSPVSAPRPRPISRFRRWLPPMTQSDPRKPFLSAEESQVFVEAVTKTGFTGGINWYRNFSRNWHRSAGARF